jgi:archaellum component FlaC
MKSGIKSGPGAPGPPAKRRRKMSFADDYPDCGQAAIIVEELLQEVTAKVAKELRDFALETLELFDNDIGTQHNDLEAAVEEAEDLKETVESLEAEVEELEETVKKLKSKLAAAERELAKAKAEKAAAKGK